MYIDAGVYLSQSEVVYSNSSFIFIGEIAKFQCITDKRPCCYSPDPIRFGEWYFPNSTAVPIQNMATTFYRNRGDDGTVSLTRLNHDVMMPTGLFCCEVPDASDVNQTLCINIGKFMQQSIIIARL